MRPRGQILRHEIGPMGMRAREGCELSYTVSGRGLFPTDMLRYDNASADDPGATDDCWHGGGLRDLREVKITGAGGCTPGRWTSFLWSVHDDIVEVAIAKEQDNG